VKGIAIVGVPGFFFSEYVLLCLSADASIWLFQFMKVRQQLENSKVEQ
jgi:hypothetical protein